MIRIEHLSYTVGDPRRPGGCFSLDDISLHVPAGAYFVLLGPTGSGKSLLVECLCGLNRVDAGRVILGGLDVTRLEPRDRGLGYLPQDYALFPHRTVRQNVSFGLRLRGLGEGRARREVDELLARLMIDHLADRFPRKLSGGEQQRVALARALAIRPKVLLLDEPVSALDETTRDAMCRMLKGLQRETGTTTIHVCHNFAEMLAVADHVGIIYQGNILQVGTPREVLERPRNTRVARFMQAGNLFPARAQRQGPWLRLATGDGLALLAATNGSQPESGLVQVMIRPENVRLGASPPASPPPGSTVLEGTIAEVIDMGPVVSVRANCRGSELGVLSGKREFAELGLAIGQTVYLTVSADDVHVMGQ